MSKIKHIVALAAAVFGMACTGDTDEADNVAVLKADNAEIFADGFDEVVFTVEFKGENVTADAVITVTPEEAAMEGNTFKTETPGIYTFTAVYDGAELKAVTVTAKEANLMLSTDYYSEGETNYFTVKAAYGSLDVSKDENLVVTDESGEPLAKDDEGYYTFTTEGTETKTINAEWNDHVAQPVEVGRPTQFYKRVGILEFTGTWCNNCPRMAEYIEAASVAYPDRAIVVAAHAFRQDPMATTYFETLATSLKATALPAILIDKDKLIVGTQSTSPQDIENRLRAIVEALPNGADCGLAVDVSVDGNEVVATVNLMAAETKEYSLAVALVESGLTAPDHPQTMPDNSKDANYVHDHVLRKIYQDNINGISLGTVNAGAQKNMEFRFALNTYDPDNCVIVVFANSTSDGKMLNTTECAVGESVGFKYE